MLKLQHEIKRLIFKEIKHEILSLHLRKQIFRMKNQPYNLANMFCGKKKFSSLIKNYELDNWSNDLGNDFTVKTF